MAKNIIISLILLLAIPALALFVYKTEDPSSRFNFKLGLDLAGGTELIYEADVSEISPVDIEDAMAVLREVVERRINSRDFAGVFGVLDPIVQTERTGFLTGEVHHRLVVELPGVTDVDEARQFIGQTPILEFKLLDQSLEPSLEEGEIDPEDVFIETGLTGRFLEGARLEFDHVTRNSLIAISFNKEGSDLFAEITRENIGEVLAIFLDGEAISLPVINEEIRDGNAQISGNFTPTEARELVKNLNFGALPVPIEIASAQKIGPVLGQETVQAGVKAGVWGLIFVSLFFLLWYRLPGFVAVLSLCLYIILMLSLFKLIPVTLTAAGIAGLILSIGMAVDANVLIFERLKEEISFGNSLKDAVSNAFKRAWPSIRDANVSSLITAVILFWFGTSLVQGFALVFGLGVIVSMFSAIVVTKTFLLVIVSQKQKPNFLFRSLIK